HAVPDMLEELGAQVLAKIPCDIFLSFREIQDHFIESVDSDGREVVSKMLQIALGIRIQATIIHLLDKYAFFLQRRFGDLHQVVESLVETGLISHKEMPKSGHINRHHADASGHLRTAEKPIAPFQKFTE